MHSANLWMFCSLLFNLLIFKCTHADDPTGMNMLFTSNTKEHSCVNLKLRRPIPEWIRGTLVRNGPGQFDMGASRFLHAFDGFAKMTSFSIQGSDNIQFSSKFLNTGFYNMSRKQDFIAPYILFDEREPGFSVYDRLLAIKNGIDNTNVNLYSVRRSERERPEMLAVSDFWQSYHICPYNLSTFGYINGKLPGQFYTGSMIPIPATAHPVIEYNKTSRIGFASSLNPVPFMPSFIHVIRINDILDRELITSIKREDIPYMHGIALSKDYAILFADPLFINTFKVIQTLRPLYSLDWFPDKGTDVYVVNLKTKEIIELKVPARVHIHHINSYQERDKLYVDYVSYPNIDFLRNMTLENFRNPEKRVNIQQNGQIIRYEINVREKIIRVLDPFPSKKNRTFVNRLDFPTINEKYRHEKYCYVYGMVLNSDDLEFENATLVKKDLCKGKDRFWSRKWHYPSEALFIPNPNGNREDDGVLLSLVLNGRKAKSYLAFVNATTMRLISKANIPDFVPFTLHGEYLEN